MSCDFGRIVIDKCLTQQFVDFLKENQKLKDSVNLRIRLRKDDESIICLIYAIEQESIMKNPYIVDRYYNGESFQFFNLGINNNDISDLEDVLILLPKRQISNLDSEQLSPDDDLILIFSEDSKNKRNMLSWFSKNIKVKLIAQGPVELIEISCKLIDDIVFKNNPEVKGIHFFSSDELFKNLLSLKSINSSELGLQEYVETNSENYKHKKSNKKKNIENNFEIIILVGRNEKCNIFNMTIIDNNTLPIRNINIFTGNTVNKDNDTKSKFIDAPIESIQNNQSIIFCKRLLYKNSINSLLTFLKPTKSKEFDFYYTLSLLSLNLGSFLIFEQCFYYQIGKNKYQRKGKYLMFMLQNQIKD